MILLLYFIRILLVCGSDSSDSCSPENLKLSDFARGRWMLEPDGSFTLKFPNCLIQRKTVEDSRECLRDSHIALMGDSLTRYSYTSLAFFLARGHWSPRFAKCTKNNFPKSLMWEKDFVSWNEYYQVSNAILNDFSASTYEICDCYRDDHVKWGWNQGDPCVLFPDGHTKICHQQEGCMENRHFRYYFPDSESSVKLSYIQFYGPMPMRGRKQLFTHIPDKEEDFLSHIRNFGDNICPMSLLHEGSPYFNWEGVRDIFYNSDSHVLSDHSVIRFKPINATNAFLPITYACSLKLFLSRDTNEKARLNFPSLWDDKDGTYMRDVIQSMGVTHLMMNIGWHSPLPRDRGGARYLSDQFQYFVGNDRKTYSSPKLGAFTWRGSTAFGPFGSGNDNDARKAENSLNNKEFNIMEMWKLTEDLWALHNWINKYNGAIEVDKFMHLFMDNGDIVYTPAELKKFNLDPKYEELLSLNIGISESLIGEWTRGVKHSRRSGESILDGRIYPIFLDHAHPQPWVYTELNNALLNAIC